MTYLLYLPLVLGVIYFMAGVVVVDAQDGQEVPGKFLRSAWLALAFSLVYWGCLELFFLSAEGRLLHVVSLVSGLLVAVIACAVPLHKLVTLSRGLGKSALEVSDEIAAEGSISPAQRVKAGKERSAPGGAGEAGSGQGDRTRR